MIKIRLTLPLEAVDDLDVSVLACNHTTNEHVFVDFDHRRPLHCLCGEHAWNYDLITAIHYPCFSWPEEINIECLNCQDLMPGQEAIRCSCGAGLCDACYELYGHVRHDTNAANSWLRHWILAREVRNG